MFSACLLLNKGLILNKRTIDSLQKGYNIFDLKKFNKFLKTDNNVKIQNNFKDDDEIYQTFSNQMNSKFRKEVQSSELKAEYAAVDTMNLETLNAKMEEKFLFFLDNMFSLKLEVETEKNYCLAILHFYYAIKNENTFPFIHQNKIFEWKAFERENNAENAKKILKNIEL